MKYLLESSGIFPRFDVIKKKMMIRRADGSLASVNDAVSLVNLHGMSTGPVYPFVEEIAERDPHNPVKDWILSKPWDGVDRLQAYYGTVVATQDYPTQLKPILMYRWALSAVAAATNEGRFSSRGTLTLQGGQGIGKTSWVASLVPAGVLRNELIKRDHHMDGGNKDSIIGAVSHWIVEIGELDSSFKRDIARLKGFLTNDCDKLRRPYARGESEYGRRTVFAATVNDDRFLVDPTGNSRWWTIAVESLNFNHDVDTQQLFAQLYLHVQQGKQWWLQPDEEVMLEAYNKRHRSVSVIQERIMDHIDPSIRSGSGGTQMTASELLAEIGINNPTNIQSKECGAVLRELLGHPKRIQGRDRWRIHKRSQAARERDGGIY